MNGQMETPRGVRLALAACAGWLALHEAHTIVAPNFGRDWLFHRFDHVAVLFIAAICCLLACRRARGERLAWALIGLGVLAWAAGEAWYTTALWDDASPPIPSPSDGGYLLFPPLLLAGLTLLLRRRPGRVSPTRWADGLIAGLAVSALSAALVFEALYRHVEGDALGVGVALAYPLTDMVMLAVIAGGLAGTGWRLNRRWGLLAGGVVAFWLADSLYAVSAVSGTYESGGWFDAGWWGGLLAIGAAAWQPEDGRSTPDGEATRLIAVPLGFGAVGLALLAYAAVERLNALAVALAVASLVAVMLRLVLTFHDNVRMLRHSRDEAVTDPLTGLGNRRALALALEDGLAAADDADPLVLVLFDLDGFKHYNDTFGHPAGDALLIRLGASLTGNLAGHGEAFRMGGDEFCALLRPGSSLKDPLVAGAAAALTEEGEAFRIGCSYGAITLPNEASTPSEALRIADQRMYQHKHSRRAPADAQSKDVLVQALAERYPDLGPHADVVAELAQATAIRLGLGDDEVRNVRLAAELHDIGKVAVPEAILQKPGPLDDSEWDFMRRHTLVGERILAAAPALHAVARLVRSSHERWDGGGYPDALAAERIPFGSRIVAVADAFDAMTAIRPYSARRTADEALAELRRCAGSQFDPAVVEAFCTAWATRAVPAAI
jgi:two-component system, cell cycle response regulator